jgi:mRNA interferase RelE/StbE
MLKKLKWFASQHDPLRFAVRLHGSEKKVIRFRIGDYRAIADVDQPSKRIVIVRIGHRREVYR